MTLKAGANRIEFRMHGERSNHGYLDSFVLTNKPFSSKGKRKPNAPEAIVALDDAQGWFPFKPAKSPPAESVIDLRGLNESHAGEHGCIVAQGPNFVREGDGKVVCFGA